MPSLFGDSRLGRAFPFLLLALVHLYTFPYFDRLRSANELPRVLMTEEIVDHGRFYIDARMREMGSPFDTSRAPNGHIYPNKAPGPSFVAVPVYIVCKALGIRSLAAITWAFRVFTVTLPSLLFLLFFRRLTPRFTDEEPAQKIALVAYALGSPAFPYALLFMSHQLAAVTAGGAFVAAVALVRGTPKRPKLTAILVGLLAGLGVMMDYQTVLASGLVGLYLFFGSRDVLRDAPLAAAGAVPPAVALGIYHKICFGGALTTGYSFATDTVTRRGFLGLVGPSGQSFGAVMLLPSNGLLVLAPWVVFSLVGAAVILRSPQRRSEAGLEAATCLAVLLAYVLFLSSLYPSYARAGWCVGPRYMTAALPFVGWLAAPGFAAAGRWLLGRVLAQGLVFASAVVFVAGATTFPHWPESFRNPMWELVFPLLLQGYAVHSLGTALGLTGLLSLTPAYLASLALVLDAFLTGPDPLRRRLMTASLSVLFGMSLLVTYRFFPSSELTTQRAFRFVTGIWEPRPPVSVRR